MGTPKEGNDVLVLFQKKKRTSISQHHNKLHKNVFRDAHRKEKESLFRPSEIFFSCYHRSRSIIILALFNPPRPNPGRREKIKLNFYFHTSMWCPKKLKPFGAPQEIKFNFLFQYSFQKCTGREGLIYQKMCTNTYDGCKYQKCVQLYMIQ